MELTDQQLANVMTGKESVELDGYRLGWRAVKPDLRSKNGYRYPWPGNWAEAPGPIIKSNKGACPSAVGDGLCVAKNFSGAAQGGIPLGTMLLVGFLPADVLGEDEQKVRVSRMWISDVLDIADVLPRIAADLRSANLRSANLGFANLRSANLRSANLGSADLRSADLGFADLRSANLGSANLGFADLRSADLGFADLRSANLGFANLRSANLGFADLRSADLGFANLRSADLRSATYNQLTLWPTGFDVKKSGAVNVDA